SETGITTVLILLTRVLVLVTTSSWLGSHCYDRSADANSSLILRRCSAGASFARSASLGVRGAHAQLAPEHHALEGEGLLAQRAHEVGDRLARKAAVVHAVESTPGRAARCGTPRRARGPRGRR